MRPILLCVERAEYVASDRQLHSVLIARCVWWCEINVMNAARALHFEWNLNNTNLDWFIIILFITLSDANESLQRTSFAIYTNRPFNIIYEYSDTNESSAWLGTYMLLLLLLIKCRWIIGSHPIGFHITRKCACAIHSHALFNSGFSRFSWRTTAYSDDRSPELTVCIHFISIPFLF